MSERVVRAIVDAGYNPATAENIARIAIEAMREPTDAMVIAAMAPYRHEIDDKMRAAFDQTIRGYWRSMIDEMLK
jgi:ribosomal silencing factor RsfS